MVSPSSFYGNEKQLLLLDHPQWMTKCTAMSFVISASRKKTPCLLPTTKVEGLPTQFANGGAEARGDRQKPVKLLLSLMAAL